MDSIVKKIKQPTKGVTRRNFLLKISAGFILPFAVLISGILLSIGLAVFNIIMKEVLLSSAGRESQFAFYAADTGGECALFWDAKQGVFPTSSDSIIYSGNLTCGGITNISINSAPSTVVGTPLAATTTFYLSNADYCSKITVGKANNKTTIESEGYNTCDVFNPRRVERAIRITY